MGKDGKPLHNIAPGEPIAEFYQPMIQGLKAQGYQTYGFGYDWRLANAANADRLRQFISEIKAPSVALVTHSMGGIIALHLLAQSPALPIRKLVMVGTPLLGTPATLKLLEVGDFVPNGLGRILRPLFNQVFRASPSWHEILPSRDYFQAIPSEHRAIARTFLRGESRPELQVTDFPAFETFMTGRSWYENHPIGVSLDSEAILAITQRIDTRVIAGHTLSTLTQIDYTIDPKRGLMLKDLGYGDGDGAVILESATLGGKLQDRCQLFKVDHTGLFAAKDVISSVVRYLAGMQS
jgi:pimeloyl-ACP methyl ester carboxylesterase